MAALTFLIGTNGCAHWYANVLPPGKSEAVSEKKSAIPSGTLGIQTILLRLQPEDSQKLEQLWPSLDEVSFDYPLRQRLELNGIRCGAIIGAVPADIQHWIDQAAERIENDPKENLGLNSEIQSYSQAYYFREGTEKDIYVKPMRSEKLTVLHHENGSGVGKTYIDPALLVKLRGEYRDDGTVRLSVKPAIEHGQFKNQIVGEEFALRREIKRDMQTWPDLSITRDLCDGQLLVLSCTLPPRALGQHFFVTKMRDQTESRLVMLIRVNKSGADRAFANRQGSASNGM